MLWSLGITFFSLFSVYFLHLARNTICFVLDDGVDDEMMMVLCMMVFMVPRSSCIQIKIEAVVLLAFTLELVLQFL